MLAPGHQSPANLNANSDYRQKSCPEPAGNLENPESGQKTAKFIFESDHPIKKHKITMTKQEQS